MKPIIQILITLASSVYFELGASGFALIAIIVFSAVVRHNPSFKVTQIYSPKSYIANLWTEIRNRK